MPIKVYLFVLLNNQSNLVMILQKFLVDHPQWIKNNIIYQSFEDIMMTNFLLSIFFCTHVLKLMKIIKNNLDVTDTTKIQIQLRKNVTSSGSMETISTFARFLGFYHHLGICNIYISM